MGPVPSKRTREKKEALRVCSALKQNRQAQEAIGPI